MYHLSALEIFAPSSVPVSLTQRLTAASLMLPSCTGQLSASYIRFFPLFVRLLLLLLPAELPQPQEQQQPPQISYGNKAATSHGTGRTK